MKKVLKVFGRIIGVLIVLAVIACACRPILTRGDRAILTAVDQLGKKYVFNTEGPNTFDCSGLIMYCYEQFGLELPHSAQEIGYDESFPTITSASQLMPGDLIFFDTVKDKDLCDHVGIWMGGNRFIHASSSKKVVMISEFDESWQNRFSWGKRILKWNPFY